jgi:hypothetical protein
MEIQSLHGLRGSETTTADFIKVEGGHHAFIFIKRHWRRLSGIEGKDHGVDSDG